MPALTPAGFGWVNGSYPAPSRVVHFDADDGTPGLVAIWDRGEERHVVFFAPTSENRPSVVSSLVAWWQRSDPNSRAGEDVQDGDLRYEAPMVPAQLPLDVLSWAGLPASDANVRAATARLAMLLAVKASEVEQVAGATPQRGEFVHPYASLERCQEAMNRVVATKPAAVPFAQPLPWRMAALMAESLRNGQKNGTLPAEFHA
ncbi:MAG: hypothetical protein GY701_02765 [Sulfitobacter sp.]|nr:hypothetical protein [Sulfitobacter sp.]